MSDFAWIEELERLEKLASKAPWSSSPVDEHKDVVLYAGDGDWVANVGNWARLNDATPGVQLETIETEHQANADLIAAARNALPKLIALARAALNIENYLENAGSFDDNPLAESHIRTFIEQAREVSVLNGEREG